MPAPSPPAPMSPKRKGEKEKEKEKEQERRDQRDNVLSTYRTGSASAATFLAPQVTSHPLTLADLKEFMSGFWEQQKEDFARQIDRMVKEMKEETRREIETLSEGVSQSFERVDEQMQSTKESLEKKIEDESITAEARQMQFAVRIRGLSETVKETLVESVAAGIAEGLESTEGDILLEMERIYRVNSRVAVQRGLPRDVVLYFVKRTLRDLLIKKSFEKKFRIAGYDVIIMRELPARYIMRKKGYKFLIEELRKRKVRFRWEMPDGMTVTYQQTSIKINTVSEAQEFYTKLLAAAIEEEVVPVERECETERRGAVGGAQPRGTMQLRDLRERAGRAGKDK